MMYPDILQAIKEGLQEELVPPPGTTICGSKGALDIIRRTGRYSTMTIHSIYVRATNIFVRHADSQYNTTLDYELPDLVARIQELILIPWTRDHERPPWLESPTINSK